MTDAVERVRAHLRQLSKPAHVIVHLAVATDPDHSLCGVARGYMPRERQGDTSTMCAVCDERADACRRRGLKLRAFRRRS